MNRTELQEMFENDCPGYDFERDEIGDYKSIHARLGYTAYCLGYKAGLRG